MKNFKPNDGIEPDDSGSPGAGQGVEPAPQQRDTERDLSGGKQNNATYTSITDLNGRLFRKARGQATRLCHMGHVLMEDRNGLVVEAMLTDATGTAQREAALAMLERMDGRRLITLICEDDGGRIGSVVPQLGNRVPC